MPATDRKPIRPDIHFTLSNEPDNRSLDLFLRAGAALMVAAVFLFLLNNYLVYWLGWPEFSHVLARFGLATVKGELDADQVSRSWIQLIAYGAVLAGVLALVVRSASRSLRDDSELYSRLAAYIIRWAYWSVLLIGLVDMLISFLRVENLLAAVVGDHLTTQLGRPTFRGMYVHYPLMGISFVIAWFSRSLGFTWLAFLVVMAEFQIVISRFVFSYEQAFMGDLVRFWYAALFLFASAYTLLYEGHVRVDVLYAGFSKRGKAWSNAVGSVLLGLPLCWTIMIQGMSSKGASINSPLLGFEISQSGFGMYVKYMMAGFLLIFAVSMAVQFTSAFLAAAADLRGEPDRDPQPDGAVDPAAVTAT